MSNTFSSNIVFLVDTNFLNNVDTIEYTFSSKILEFADINYGKIVVELKFPTYLKNTVVEMIRYFNFYPQRHSKYLVGMSKLGYCSYL